MYLYSSIGSLYSTYKGCRPLSIKMPMTSCTGNGRSIKERHTSYYTTVKSELIYVYEGSPAQCAWANHNACTVMNVKKNVTEKEK